MRPTNKRRQSDILFILVSSFIVVVAWVGFNIYHIVVTSTISQHIQYQLTPIDPNFNQEVIQQLKTRKDINPIFEQQGKGTASQSAIVTAPTLSPAAIPASEASRFAPTGESINRQGQ